MGRGLRWTKQQYLDYLRRSGNAPVDEKTIAAQPPDESPKLRKWVLDIEPVPAPRMTRRDKWMKPPRECVRRYFEYRDALRSAVKETRTPDEIRVKFTLPMPASWSTKKKSANLGKPHRARPDRDNLEKAVMDALFVNDSSIWKGEQEKRWGTIGGIELTMIWH